MKKDASMKFPLLMTSPGQANEHVLKGSFRIHEDITAERPEAIIDNPLATSTLHRSIGSKTEPPFKAPKSKSMRRMGSRRSRQMLVWTRDGLGPDLPHLCFPEESIGLLRQLVSTTIRLRLEDFTLSWHGKLLVEDDRTLEDHGIEHDDVLDVMIRDMAQFMTEEEVHAEWKLFSSKAVSLAELLEAARLRAQARGDN